MMRNSLSFISVVALISVASAACSSYDASAVPPPDGGATNAVATDDTESDGVATADSPLDSAKGTEGAGCGDAAVSPFTHFIPVGKSFHGRDYASWSVEWWKWLIAIPQATSPAEDGDCTQGQSGAVWFLAGANGSAPAKRTCTIPPGKTLFFPLANSICFPCSEDEGCTTPKTEAELVDCTKLEKATSLSVTVDGRPITVDLEPYHLLSKEFSFKGPSTGGIFGTCTVPISTNTCGIPIGDRYAVSDGYWLALRPLKKGKHVLAFKAVVPGTPVLTQDVQYTLTIE